MIWVDFASSAQKMDFKNDFSRFKKIEKFCLGFWNSEANGDRVNFTEYVNTHY